MAVLVFVGLVFLRHLVAEFPLGMLGVVRSLIAVSLDVCGRSTAWLLAAWLLFCSVGGVFV